MMSDEPRVYYDICIWSDDHAIALSNKLDRETNVLHIRFRLEGELNFTHEGLKAIAQSIGRHPELQTLSVNDSFAPLSVESVVAVAKVLYLKGNLQNLHEIEFLNERAQFLFDCFRVGRNSKWVKEYHIPSKRYPTEFTACLHGNRNTQLQNLQVSIEFIFTPEIASLLASAMCNSQATKLILNNYNPRATMKEGLLRILCRDGIQASGRVWECFQIDANYALVDDMSPVAEVIPFVKMLWICNVGEKLQTKEEMYCLFAGLERSCNLSRLGLIHCRLNADDVRMLCRALRHHRSLKELNLAGNKIGDAGVAALVEHWDEHPMLETLSLNYTAIGPTGAEQLMNAVANRHSMKILEMGGNNFAYDVLQMIGEQLPNLQLKVLDLHGYTDNEDGKKSAYQSLLRGLKDNHCLHWLILPSTISFDCRKFGSELSFYVALSKHGRYLITDANAVGPTVWCTILSKCKRHVGFSSSMMYYFLREQPHLLRRAQNMAME